MQTFNPKHFGLQVGDIVKTTNEHNRLLSRPIKDGVILFIDDDSAVATVDLGDGERTLINCYWLKKAQLNVKEGMQQ